MGLDEEKTWAAETAELDGSPLEDDPWRGRTLDDKYEVIDKLGEGGMGAVYEAVHRRIGRHVAIKMLRPELAAHPLSRHRFEREARAAAAAGHPNVVQVTDIGELREPSADGRTAGEHARSSGEVTMTQLSK
jgi:serine/threonine protein kinase